MTESADKATELMLEPYQTELLKMIEGAVLMGSAKRIIMNRRGELQFIEVPDGKSR